MAYSTNLRRAKSIWYFWAHDLAKIRPLLIVYLLIGFGQESVGTLLNVWTYQGLYAPLWVRALLVIIGYPLFLTLVNETFVLFRYTGLSSWVVWVGTIVLLIGWSELPNLIAPLYHVNPPFAQFRALIFIVGYSIQVVLSVRARRYFLG